jgi:hypothetical protein
MLQYPCFPLEKKCSFLAFASCLFDVISFGKARFNESSLEQLKEEYDVTSMNEPDHAVLHLVGNCLT